jgi:hypothetical protein
MSPLEFMQRPAEEAVQKRARLQGVSGGLGGGECDGCGLQREVAGGEYWGE